MFETHKCLFNFRNGVSIVEKSVTKKREERIQETGSQIRNVACEVSKKIGRLFF